jgi:hypothetical protein
MSASAAEVGRKVICADGWRVTMHIEVRRGPLQGPNSERQGPTNRMSAAMFSGSPHSTRATLSDPTERHVTSEAADEATGTRRSTRSASTRISLPARCSTVVIGDTVRVAITEPCPRGVMITLPQGDLLKDSGILRTAAQHNAVNVGIYASVINGGRNRRGDTVVLA